MAVRYCCVLMTSAYAALCTDDTSNEAARTATIEWRWLRMNYSLPLGAENTSRGRPTASALGPPGYELVEVDEPVVVRVDVLEADLDLAARHFRIELVEHGSELVDLDPSIAIAIVVIEGFAQLVEVFFGRSVLRH